MGFRFRNNLKPLLFYYYNCKSHLVSSRHNPLPLLHLQLQHPSAATADHPHYAIPRRWHLGDSSHDHHHHHHHHHPPPSGQEGEDVFRLGLGADIGLAAGKAVTGYLSGSTAIIADAAHSISDVVLSGVALWSFKAGKAPKDKEHPYGHGKFESLGALGISCMLLATGGGIVWHALDLLLGLLSAAADVVDHSVAHGHAHGHVHSGHNHGVDMDYPILALSMAVVSISVKEGLYRITKRAGERHGSGLMKANAWHHRADAVSSVVALIGVGGSILGVKFLDPLAGLVVAGMILKAGLETGHQSVLELVDAAIPLEQLDMIKQTILQVEGVKGCHRLRGRRAGSYMFLDVHIEVDPLSSVSAAHGIGENVRGEIHKSHPEIAEVYIHIDPAIMDSKRNLDRSAKQKGNNSVHDKDIEPIVSDIFSSKFPEKLEVQHITHHLLQGKILLQIEVSMPSDILIRDAMQVAAAAEKEILRAASNISHVSIHLRLGRPIPKFGP